MKKNPDKIKKFDHIRRFCRENDLACSIRGGMVRFDSFSSEQLCYAFPYYKGVRQIDAIEEYIVEMRKRGYEFKFEKIRRSTIRAMYDD